MIACSSNHTRAKLSLDIAEAYPIVSGIVSKNTHEWPRVTTSNHEWKCTCYIHIYNTKLLFLVSLQGTKKNVRSWFPLASDPRTFESLIRSYPPGQLSTTFASRKNIIDIGRIYLNRRIMCLRQTCQLLVSERRINQTHHTSQPYNSSRWIWDAWNRRTYLNCEFAQHQATDNVSHNSFFVNTRVL